jgi:hypothetical protein
MKIEKGNKVRIFCLADKPEGTIILVDGNKITVEFDRGVMTVDLDDIIEGPDMLQVLNYIDIQDMTFSNDSDDRSKFEDKMIGVVDKFKGTKKITKNEIMSMFMDYVKKALDEDISLSPTPCIFDLIKDGRKGLAMTGISLPQHQVYVVISKLLKDKPNDLVFGLVFDNMSKGGIDKKYKKVLCVLRMEVVVSENASIDQVWSYGFTGFNKRSDIGELDWDNEFWSERMKALLVSANIVETTDKIGRAYGGKIEIKKWAEMSDGYLYEGEVIVSKLDKNTKAYLKKHKLDINKSKDVVNFFKDNGMELDFMDTKDGTVNCMVSNTGFIFMNRNSHTRVLLEAVEAVANMQK